MTFDTRVYVYSLCFLDTHAIQCTLRSERFGFIFFFYALGLSAIFLTFTISVCTGEVSIYITRGDDCLFFFRRVLRARDRLTSSSSAAETMRQRATTTKTTPTTYRLKKKTYRRRKKKKKSQQQHVRCGTRLPVMYTSSSVENDPRVLCVD
uniref:Uncharacterized protein n=1 Tax=Sipha flava TaxID=143950 RepID=A0A2S2R143_9HEMI